METMTNDFPALIAACQRLKESGDTAILATIIATEGSTYRKAGASMLITRDGGFVGLLGGGCFEPDLARRAERVFSSGKSEVVRYDMRGPEDTVWGLGLGCNGAVDILLLPLTPENDFCALPAVAPLIAANQLAVLAMVCESNDGRVSPGECLLYSDGCRFDLPDELRAEIEDAAAAAARAGSAMLVDHPFAAGDLTVFYLPVLPPHRLLLIGAGPDAAPITRIAGTLGWHVTVADHRESYCRPERFPDARQVVNTQPEDLGSTITLDDFEAAVLMTHRFEYDLRYLRQLAATRIPYIGLLGPRARREQLLQDLGNDAGGIARRVYGPVGLDLGGELPEEIALSLVAEIQAVLHGREGGHIAAPEKAPTVSIDNLYTIVLAAGGSARFDGFKQLLEVGGESLLRRAVRLATEISDERVVVVHGPKPTKCQREIAGLAVTNVVNEGWQEGMAGSLRRALSVVPEHCAGVLVMLCDQPMITAQQLRGLVERWISEPDRIAASAYADTSGVPAIFPAGLIPDLLKLSGDRGAKTLIGAFGEAVNLVDIPEAELDIDTQDDYARILVSNTRQIP